MPRVLSKKMKRKSKKGVSWAQMGRNRRLKTKLKKMDEEREIFYKKYEPKK